MYQFLFMAVLAIGFAACSDEDKEFFEPVVLEGQGAYFPQKLKTSYQFEGTEGSFTLNVLRTATTAAADVAVNVEMTEGVGLFTVPSIVSFAAGSAESSLTISYAGIERGKNYSMIISLGDKTPYGDESKTLSMIYPNEVVEEWVVVSEKAIYTDNLYSMFGANNIQMTGLVVEKEKNSNKYRFKSPYDNDYAVYMFGDAVLPANFEAPYIVLDGEKFKAEAPGKYWIAPTVLGLAMINGVGMTYDPELDNFGSVAGTLSTSSGPISPTSTDYPLGSYDAKTKTFNFGATFHYLLGDGGGYAVVGDGKFTLSLDPALLEPDYNRDYTWSNVEDATGFYTSGFFGESWMQEVQVSAEDSTFYRFTNVFAQGGHLYFNYDVEKGKVTMPEAQNTGLKTMNNVVYLRDGGCSVDENGVFTFNCIFYLISNKGKENEVTYDLTKTTETFIWGKTEMELFESDMTIDDYVGVWAVPAVSANGVAANVKVAVTKVSDNVLAVKGLSFDAATGGTYDDDTTYLIYDAETGLLVFQPQVLENPYVDGEDVFSVYAVPFNSASSSFTTAETLIGGVMPNGTLKFINNPNNQGVYDAIIHLLVTPEGKAYLFTGYWAGLVWNPVGAQQAMATLAPNADAQKTMVEEATPLRKNICKELNIEEEKKTKKVNVPTNELTK